MIKPKPRQIVLLVGLVVSIGAALWVRGNETAQDDVVLVAAGEGVQAATAEEPSQTPTLALDRLNHRVTVSSDANPFLAKSWFVAPPAPPPAPPPKPTAPAMPFQFMGQFEDTATGRWVIYLARGEESFSVSPGDKFADNYQFEGIEKGNLVISYLPLSIKQYVPMRQGSE